MFSGYRQLDSGSWKEEEESLTSGSEEGVQYVAPSSRDKPRRFNCGLLLTLLNLGILAASIVTVTWGAGRVQEQSQAKTVNDALKQTSVYSPLFDDTEVRLVHTTMNGSVFKTLDTPWNGLPSDEEKEAVWKDFQHIRPIAITSEQIRKMGKDPAISAKLEDEYWHMGDDAYIGAMDIFHQIHCLARLRMVALDQTNAFSNVNSTEHTIHCVDMLMQHLLCAGDVGFITYNWYKTTEYAQPNFNVKKECKDWRQLVEYRDTHAVPDALYSTYFKPEGVVELEEGSL